MKRWLGGLLLCLVAIASQRASAAYTPTGWAELAGGADKIVMGTIVEVNGSQQDLVQTSLNQENLKPPPTVKLLVEDHIAGPGAVGETIVVHQFHDWTCARRSTPYAVGQRVIMFLKNEDDVHGPYRIMGAADEGETMIIDLVGGERYLFDGNPDNPWHWKYAEPYQEFRTAIADFRASFRFVAAADPWVKNGQFAKYVPLERIDFVSSQPADTAFRKRYPPGTHPPLIAFKDRSPSHAKLFAGVQGERLRIAKYRTPVDRRNAGAVARP